MPSTNKTTHLNLNKWIASDIPKRADFVSDNQIIDNAFYEHISDSTAHLTAAEKAKVDQPFYISQILGSGVNNATINLEFEPRMVFMYKTNSPFTKYNGTSTDVYSASATATATSGGVSISGRTIILRQDSSAADGVKYNLNENNARYVLIAFR